MSSTCMTEGCSGGAEVYFQWRMVTVLGMVSSIGMVAVLGIATILKNGDHP